MNVLAIDIGGTKLAAATVDASLRITGRREIPTPASKTPQALSAALETLLSPLKAYADRGAIAATGVIHHGVLTAMNPDNLGGLAHFPLTETVSQMTGLPCLAVNDAQAAAWAEYHARKDMVSEMVFITVSTGVGGGVIIHGQLQIGQSGLAGHFGHTLADPGGPRCGCGRTGCVEAIASGRALAAAATDTLAGLDAKAIFAKASEGEPAAIALVGRSAQTLARLIADLKAVSDCQLAVIGGSIGLADGYLSQVRDALAREPAAFQTPLAAAHYRHDAGLIGAALLAQGENV
ncbi:N-acetylmannosamine kinase [Cronobacter sakazakii]|uniref:N-acetylmannosamine kinase n=1 Tax=Cronobacter sakazakii TaxID=28141 RepID=UPI000948FDBE|nr:N-acetylmannosamine kinase [Cronobacter sakazakii]ELY2522593.1 N-acetylmannosamine kinase [Cronobacter sakazakii]ELY2910561.1 N-acetylmannosamine kinase [Cronobacter sakazakii]ELY4754714.1 N-acetylmannosamine kinase [Cronobacter sakazakii]ELY4766446.1 N-acetylmannosamine kinase [Cronobacter sakazakii]PUX29569.1 N-acetylmannosamine kinase [Cronobacter sakazakii]